MAKLLNKYFFKTVLKGLLAIKQNGMETLNSIYIIIITLRTNKK